jgi:hypothetical protein
MCRPATKAAGPGKAKDNVGENKMTLRIGDTAPEFNGG